MVGGKKHQFRMHKEVQVLQGTTAGGMNIYDQEAWQGLQFALQHLEDTGVLGCSSKRALTRLKALLLAVTAYV